MRIHAGDTIKDIAECFLVDRKTVYNIRRRYKEDSSIADRPRPGRPKSNIRKNLAITVRAEVNANPCTSIRGLARKHDVPETTMRRVVKKDLDLQSRAVVPVQMLTPSNISNRFKRSKKILNWLNNHGKDRLVFSDEKNFTVDAYTNPQNTWYLANSPEDIDPAIKFTPRSKHPAKAMMLGMICADGFTLPPIWINGNLNGAKYRQILGHVVFPALDLHFGAGNYTFTQDGAPSHTSKSTQKYLKGRLGSSRFWSKALWPPSSPNLNPLDYYAWQHVQSKACRNSHSNIADLKASVDAVWAALTKDEIRKACNAFRTRIKACIAAKGGVFEK